MRIQSSFFGVAVLALFTCSLHAQDITETSPAFPQKADTSARRGITPQNAEGYPFEVNSLDFLVGDSLEFVRDDSLNYTPGEALVSMSPDSIAMKNDSIAVKKTSSPFKTKITYNADSIVMSNSTRKAYLYKNAVLKYGDIQLKGDYMELDSDRKTVYSAGLPDSTGKMAGLPVFTQGEEEFETKSMTYNFKTRRGVIHEVITEQSGGYLHAGIAKRYDNGQIDIKKGKFTTCENEHPHFYLALTKAKVIPNSKTITGPAYVVLEDVPLPIGIPFGFIPTIKDNRQSGILIPTWGEEATRGFNLTGGGYYFALSQHFDLKTTFDVYSKGTWGFEMASTYLQRYKFRGSFQSRFYKNVSGEPGLNQTKSTSYSLKWSHAMDSKAIPGQSFNISVDFSTNKFDQLHNYTNTTQLMTNTKRSSIAYSKNWTNKPFHLTLNANHSQSSGSDQMTIMFPSLNFTVDRFYPFRPKNISGETKWYQDIQLSYSAQMQNTLKGKETKLFSDSAIHHMVNGFKHTIPISMNIKLLKQINITPTMNYTGVMYLNHQEKRFDETYVNSDGTFGKVVTDTIQGISYAHGVTPNLSISYAPKLYVMAEAKNPLATLQKVRNVITTSVGFSYVPDVSSIMPDYYRTLEYDQVDSEGVTQHFTEKYSIYDGYLYGTPTLPGKSGSFSFSLRDNIEAKIRPRAFRKDTIPTEESELKKIKLLENIAFNASYNPFADSMKLSNISFSGNNAFLDDKLNITFNGSFSPYALDEKGRAYNQLLIKNGGFLRLTSFSLSPTFRIDGTMGKKDESESEDASPEDASTPRETPAEQAPVNPALQGGILPYDYFSIPWSLSASYDFTYSKQSNTANILQTLRLNGDFSLTPKWKIAFSTGYDVESKQVTHTSLTIDRDLHCWVMSLNISPFGEYKYYGFQINVKSSMLSDLKYRKNKSQYDNVSF